MGYNLLVRLREHEKTNEPIYVLGKTKYDKNLQRYPKGTKLYYIILLIFFIQLFYSYFLFNYFTHIFY